MEYIYEAKQDLYRDNKTYLLRMIPNKYEYNKQIRVSHTLAAYSFEHTIARLSMKFQNASYP